MFTSRFVTCAAVALCAMAVGTASAAFLVKFKDWTPMNAGLIENPEADGMALLRYDQLTDTTQVTMVLHRLQPNTEYCIAVIGDVGDFVSWFTTSSTGSISFQNENPWGGDWTSDNPQIFILRDVPLGRHPFFESPPLEDNIVLHSIPYIK